MNVLAATEEAAARRTAADFMTIEEIVVVGVGERYRELVRAFSSLLDPLFIPHRQEVTRGHPSADDAYPALFTLRLRSKRSQPDVPHGPWITWSPSLVNVERKRGKLLAEVTFPLLGR